MKWRNIHIIKTEERTLNMTDHEQIEERYLVKKVSFLFDRKFSILRKKGVKKIFLSTYRNKRRWIAAGRHDHLAHVCLCVDVG